VASGKYEDLKAGVVDPTKVVRTALQNAASKEKPSPGGMGGMDY
jgi:chaperonin GroEL (HSP60 family)